MRNNNYGHQRNRKYFSSPMPEQQTQKISSANEILSSPDIPLEFRQQLRKYYEQNQNLRLAYQIQKDSHLFAKEQLKQVSLKIEQYRNHVENIQNEYQQLKQKYKKLKIKKMGNSNERTQGCSPFKIKQDNDLKQLTNKFQKQRQVFLKQQQLLKSQINQLKTKLESTIQNKQQIQAKIKVEYHNDRVNTNLRQQKLKSEIQTLVNQNKSLQRQVSYLCNKIQQKQRQIIIMQNRFQQIQSGNTKTQQNILYIEDQIQRLKKQNKHLKYTLKSAEQAYKINIDKLQQQNLQFQNKLKTLYGEVQHLQEMNQDRQCYISEIRKSIDVHAPILANENRSNKTSKNFRNNELQQTINNGYKINPSIKQYTKNKKFCGLIRKYSLQKNVNHNYKNKSYQKICAL